LVTGMVMPVMSASERVRPISGSRHRPVIATIGTESTCASARVMRWSPRSRVAMQTPTLPLACA
jgi:hypothetical protein